MGDGTGVGVAVLVVVVADDHSAPWSRVLAKRLAVRDRVPFGIVMPGETDGVGEGGLVVALPRAGGRRGGGGGHGLGSWWGCRGSRGRWRSRGRSSGRSSLVDRRGSVHYLVTAGGTAVVLDGQRRSGSADEVEGCETSLELRDTWECANVKKLNLVRGD